MSLTQSTADLIYSELKNEPLTDGQQLQLEQWRAASPANEAVYRQMQDDSLFRRELAARAAAEAATPEAYQHFLQRVTPANKVAGKEQIRSITYLKWAAAVVMVLGVAIWLLLRRSPERIKTAAHDIAAASGHALLKLSDGRVIELDSTPKNITDVSGAQFTAAGNRLVTAQEPGKETENAILSLSTPNGGQYQAALPDGSVVWLNAASTVRFPAAFNGKERRIAITGEVYIEVAPNAKQPFYITTPQTEVLVLGTSINLNTYANEPAERTTLVAGKIQVHNAVTGKPVILLPGTQSVAAKNTLTISSRIDVASVLAWKNGFFNIEDLELEELMRQFERWYDIKVVYEGKPVQERFRGKMDRGLTLQQMLKALGEFNIRYRLAGRTLTIL